jgi:ParB/RepB/Spo0J family partition protein
MSFLDKIDKKQYGTLDANEVQEQMAAIDSLPSKGPRTSVGRILAESEKYHVGAPQRLLPHQVRRGPMANRLPDFFSSEVFLDLKRRIQESGGNNQPAMVVDTGDISDNGDHIYEIIYGHCRHEACSQLSNEVINGQQKIYPFLAQIMHKDTPMTVRAALTHSENAGRTNTTGWENAKWYASLIQTKIYSTCRALAYSIGENENTVNRYVRIVDGVDPRIMDLVLDERNLSLTSLEKTTKFKQKHEKFFELRMQEMVNSKTRLTCDALFKKLLAPVTEVPKAGAEELIVGKDGSTLGTLKRKERGTGFSLTSTFNLKPEGWGKLREVIERYTLKGEGGQS